MKIIAKEGSLDATFRMCPKLPSKSSLLASSSVPMKGSKISTDIIDTAKTMKTICHSIIDNRAIAVGGPIICPADPEAVAIDKLICLFSSELALPITARITPNPVPAMPNPTNIS